MKKEYPKHDYMEGCSSLNKYGEWVPSIPFGFNFRECSCGRKFRNKENYEGHYALKHILGL